MKLEQPITDIYYPRNILAPWVDSYILLQHQKGGIQDNIPWTIMPDCTGYLILHVLTDHSNLSVVGPRSIFKNICRTNRVLTLIVKFKPWGLSGLLPFPLNEIKDSSIPLVSVFGSSVLELKGKLDELARAGKIPDCLSELENFLTENLIPEKIHSRLQYIANTIHKRNGKISIKEVAEDAGVSDRYLRRIFSSKIGLNPKRFSMITRVTNVVKQVDDGKLYNWTDTALTHGYFDQSHLIEDFNVLLGQSPEVFMSRSNREEII